jgi:hypothetical protein
MYRIRGARRNAQIDFIILDYNSKHSMSLPNPSDIEATKVDDSESEESSQSLEARNQEYKSPHNLEYLKPVKELIGS